MPEFKGEEQIRAPVNRVWDFLSDPSKVSGCIPGAKNVEVVDENTFKADVSVAVGFIRNTYKVTFKTLDKKPPGFAKLGISGQGGGSNLNGEALVDLAEANGSTRLAYTANVVVGGSLAGIGSRFINGTADKIIREMFGCVKKSLEG